MSEYQYYEFQAIDRPLTAAEMRDLREYSSRARITSTSFVNDYAWGSFKGTRTRGWSGTSTHSSTWPTGAPTSSSSACPRGCCR